MASPLYDQVSHLLPEFGYACEVGASDGQFLSNTLEWEHKGWIVLCVEANPELEVHGRAARKLWRAVACAEQDSEARDFHLYGNPPWASASALTPLPAYTAQVGGEPTVIQVPCRRLDRLLEEAGFPRLDLLAIDVEGGEPEVLAGFTAERWRPTVLVVESLADTLEPPAGYEKRGRITFDTIFVRSNA